MYTNSSFNQILSPVSELRFGFLASSVICNLESDDYQIRRSSIDNLITTIQTTASNQIDVDRFLDYIIKFLDDENIIVAEKSCTVIETLCANLHGNIALYKNHFLKIAISQLGSKKKFLYTFGQNILHIMIKSISQQKIVSEIFSMTLMSPPHTLKNLFNFIANEVKNDIISPSILTKYAFIFEDSLNSDNISLAESAQNCLQIIKIKDPTSFYTISQRIKISYNNLTQAQNTTPSSNSKYFGIKAQTSFSNHSFSQTQHTNSKPIISPNNRYPKSNRSFISHATFALEEDENIEITTSKPGSADDSKVPTARVNIGNSSDLDIPQIFDDFDEENNNEDITTDSNDSITAFRKNSINSSESYNSFSPTKVRLLRPNLT